MERPIDGGKEKDDREQESIGMVGLLWSEEETTTNGEGNKRMKVEIELPEIEGFEYTGEFRYPKQGECFLEGTSKVSFAAGDFLLLKKIILKEKEKDKTL